MVDWKQLYVIWFVVLDGRLETIVCYMVCCIKWSVLESFVSMDLIT